VLHVDDRVGSPPVRLQHGADHHARVTELRCAVLSESFRLRGKPLNVVLLGDGH
jgi:hypothetical protein